MEFNKISDQMAVAPQISVSDIAEIANMGFKTIICNRPDHENHGQVDFAEIEAAAKEHGIRAMYQPVISGRLQESDAEEFGSLTENAQEPILAYCRTGTRSSMLWALSQSMQGTPLQDIISATRSAGYDFSGAIDRIADVANRGNPMKNTG